ncbi:nuclear transport factor 2 family protein [Castellaniella hirudinis]|uniref:Nuclear transport factor 2 family protein n=1 Tax=Castellaniella hirudinis TaxID=1144617 RepID=A0ABV8RVN3_9BURK
MMVERVAVEQASVEAELARLNAEYWFRVDRPQAGSVAQLYADEGRMVFGERRIEGRAAIEAFFLARNASRPVRTTRHVSSNLRLEALGPDCVRVHSIITVYSGLGASPLEIDTPSSVVDFTDICTRRDGRWTYVERCGSAIFVGPGAAPFLLEQLPPQHRWRAANP